MSRQFYDKPGDRFEFGFTDFAATNFAEYGPAIPLAYTDSHLANEMSGEGNGAMSFSNIIANGLEGVFTPKEVERLLAVLSTVRQRAEV